MSIEIHLEKPDLYEHLKDSSDERPVTYEEALDLAGANNGYQIRLAFLVALGMTIAGLQVMSFPFIFESPNVQCMSSNGEWYDCTPNEDTCQLPMRPQPGAHNTVLSAFGLFCGGDQYKILVETTYMVASALGVVTLAPIADKYGKRIALLSSYIITCVSLFGCSFAPNWILFVISTILSGLGRAPFIYYGYQVLVEVSNEKFRAIGVLVMGVTFACGAAVAGVLDDLVDSNYQYFYLFCIAIPSLLGLPLVYFWADESPLSYFPMHKYDKAKQELGRIAKINKKTLPAITFVEEYNYNESWLSKAHTQDTDTKTAKDYTYLDLFRYRSLRKATLGGAYIAFVTYFVFYGQMLAVDVLSDNPIVVSVFTSIVEAIACAASAKLLTKLTRRALLISSFSVTAVAFSIFGIISLFNNCGSEGNSCSEAYIWFSYIELGLGRFWIATLMCTTFVYANELFPTVIRSRGSGLMNFCGRVGSIIPSSVIYLCKESGFSPAIIFGLLAVPAIYVSWTMQETKGKPLANYILEEEDARTTSQEITDDENVLM